MKTKYTHTIDSIAILHSIMTNWIMIAIITVAGLLIGIAISIASYMHTEMNRNYAITTSLAVTSVTEDGLFTTHSDSPNSTDIYLAEDMVDSVIYVIRGDTTLNAALKKLHMPGVSATDIRNNLSMSQYKETQIIVITLNWPVAEEGIKILEAINEVAPDILIESLKIGGVSVVDMPKSGELKNSAVNFKLWLIMAMAGLITGIGYTVFKFLYFPTVFNTRTVNDSLGMDVIGSIPYSKTYFSHPFYQVATETSNQDYKVQQSFIAMAHVLKHRLGEKKPVCIYITSTLPNEGKTSVLANLAIELAELEQKVLMVDLDVNNPILGTLFMDKIDYYHSVNAVYREEVSPELAVEHIDACLDLLPIYLEKNRMKLNDEMLDIISRAFFQYDYVLIDTAPVGLSANTVNLNRIADTALFVVRQDVTPISRAEEALTRLNNSGSSILGAVLNGIHKKIGIYKKNYSGSYYYHDNKPDSQSDSFSKASAKPRRRFLQFRKKSDHRKG